MENNCKFHLAWIGECKNPATHENMCDQHNGIKCCSCGEQATHECSETMTLVCGAPLCDNCEHTICENGCNGGAKLPEGYRGHCKKDAQVYTPWYMRTKE